MHRSQLNEKIIKSDTYRFRSIDKENFVTVRMSTPAKYKSNVYYQNLLKMQERHLMKIQNNQKMIEEMKAKCLVYKTISMKQAERFDKSQTNLAKEELLSEVMTYKSQVNRIQDLLAAVTEEHEARKLRNEKTIEQQSRNIDKKVAQIARLQKQIAQSQHILLKRRQTVELDRSEIEKNESIIGEKEKQEAKYLETMKIIKSRSEPHQ